MTCIKTDDIFASNRPDRFERSAFRPRVRMVRMIEQPWQYVFGDLPGIVAAVFEFGQPAEFEPQIFSVGECWVQSPRTSSARTGGPGRFAPVGRPSSRRCR